MTQLRDMERILRGRNPLSRLISLPWAWIMEQRNRAYNSGRFASISVDIPVICVGNISMGGSGKSPLVMHLARELSSGRALSWLDAGFSGRRVAILSRGYRRQSSGFVMVSDGEGALVDARLSGDEPAMFARLLPGVQIAVCEDRVEGARQLKQRGAQLILLDDGFQHRRLKRDLDILVWDCRMNPATEALLPFGRLREDPSAAARAGLLVLNHCASGQRAKDRLRWFRRYSLAPAISMHTRHTGLCDPVTGAQQLPAGGRFGIFCGLGQPRAFEAAMTLEYGMPAYTKRYRDHHWFNARDLRELDHAVRKHKLESLICTWKDAVRIPAGHGLPLRVAEQGVKLADLK